MVEAVTDHLLTPFGLRSLSPNHPDYKPTYSGDLRARDAAYHQGTVWAWLIGPYIDAELKLGEPLDAVARGRPDGVEMGGIRRPWIDHPARHHVCVGAVEGQCRRIGRANADDPWGITVGGLHRPSL